MLRIGSEGIGEYRKNLSEVILKNIDKKIVFIMPLNILDQYMFERSDIEKVGNNLFFSRVEQPYDFLDILKTITRNSYFQISKTLIIAPYEELIKDNPEIKPQVEKILERLENKYKKNIIVMELKWATQSLLNAR